MPLTQPIKQDITQYLLENGLSAPSYKKVRLNGSNHFFQIKLIWPWGLWFGYVPMLLNAPSLINKRHL